MPGPDPTPIRRKDGYLDRPMTVRGCVAWTSLWAVVMSLPIVLFVLVARGEFSWRRGELTYDRVFVLTEADAAGIGYERARVVSDQRAADGPVCVRTEVSYWMLRGQGLPASACECYAANGRPTGGCEASP